MKKSLAKKSLVSVSLLAVVCMSGISYAEDTTNTQPAKEKGPALQQLESAAGKKIEEVKPPAVPKPTPVNPSKTKSDLNSSKTSTEAGTEKESMITNIVVASSRDVLDQPCYAGGKYVGNCSRNKPYYNAFSGECYATLQDCKKADGDLESVPGKT